MLAKGLLTGGPTVGGETQSKVLLTSPCASALNLLREPCGVPVGPVVEARRSGRPGGHASVPQGLISDRKASDLAPSLSSTTGLAECGLHVMVRQARDRQFEYLNAQQGALEDESGDDFWSNPQRGHGLVEMSDLVPLRCDDNTIPVDTKETMMQINITGSASLQRNIRLLCTEYIDILSPTVRHELARVPPLSMNEGRFR